MRVPCPAARITTANRRWSLIGGSNGMAAGSAPVGSETKRAAPTGTGLQRFKARRLKDVLVIFVTDESHLLDVRLLRHGQHLVDDLVASGRVGLQVEFRNRIHLLGRVEIGAKLRHADRRAVPQYLVLSVDRQDVLDRVDNLR